MIDVHFEALMPWSVQDVARALRDLPWTFPRGEGESPQPGRFDADLRVPVGASGWVSHRAHVELGDMERTRRSCRVPVTISASPRFPTFHGAFEAHDVLGDTVLALKGECRIPLGIAGQVGDAAAGGSLARASLRHFFEATRKALNSDLQATAPPWRPAVVPDDLRDA